MRKYLLVLWAAAAVAALPGRAGAVEVTATERADGPARVFGIGIDSLSAGAGLGNFTGEPADELGAGGAWDVKMDLDVTRPVDVEIAYVGGVNSVETAGLEDYNLYTNGLQLGLKVAPIELDHRLKPYVSGGLGIERISVAKDSQISQAFQPDTVGSVPLAAGADLRIGELFTVGARAQWDLLWDEEFFVEDVEGNADRIGFFINVGATNL